MTETVNLQEIETDALREYYQDGLMEILLGMLLLATAALLDVRSNMLFMLAFSIFILVPLWNALKKRFTYPRIGYVNFPTDEDAGKGTSSL